jgi:hypothetical protein
MGVYLSSGQLERLLHAIESGERVGVRYHTLDFSIDGKSHTESVVPVLHVGDIRIAVRHDAGKWNDELPRWANP